MSYVTNPFNKPYCNKNLKVYENFYTVYMQKPFSNDFDVYFAYTDTVSANSTASSGKNDFFVLEACNHGRAILTINEKDFRITEGDCYVTYPQSMISSKTHEDSSASFAWFGFNGLKTELFFRKLGVTPSQPFLSREAYPFISDTISEMASNFQEDNLSNQLFQTAQVNLIFSKLFSLADRTFFANRNVSEHVQKAINHIEAHFHEHLTVSDLSAAVRLDRSYFFEIFKEATGFSPQEFLIHFRIKHACALLTEKPHMPISDVANAVGYNATNFMHMFKKETGYTPSEYRRLYEHDKT